MNNNKYKEEIIKLFFDRFEDRYRCNEYIVITNKSVAKTMSGITQSIFSNIIKKYNINTSKERLSVMYMIASIVEQINKELKTDIICCFYNTATREIETDQDKINLLQMIFAEILKIDEVDYLNVIKTNNNIEMALIELCSM